MHINIFLIGPDSMEICTDAAPSSIEVPSSDVAILEGHTSEVRNFTSFYDQFLTSCHFFEIFS